MSHIIRGHIEPRLKLPTLIATDGSARYEKRSKSWHTGIGWMGTDGSYGLGREQAPADMIGRDAAVVAELRAVWYAVRDRVPNRTAVILLDSGHAIHLLRAWARGELTLPAGYWGGDLRQFATFVEQHHPLMAWCTVKGHDGNLLNEAADSLAKIGREWCRGVYTQAQAGERARRLVEGFMADDRLAEVA